MIADAGPEQGYLLPDMAVEDNLDYLARIVDESVQLVVTSPPYNIGKEYESKESLSTYVDQQRVVISECVRTLNPRGSICWQVGNYVERGTIVPLDVVLFPIFTEHGLKLRNRIVWTFGHGLHSTKRLSGRYETILWFTKGDEYVFNLDPIRVPAKYPDKRHYKGANYGKPSGHPLGKNPSDIWNIPNVKSNHIEKTVHPCQFPVELIERLVLALTDPGDTVLDPYLGVGTSVIAALKHGRHGIGCDIEPLYLKIAEQRLRALFRGELKTRPMNRPIYDPKLPNGGQ